MWANIGFSTLLLLLRFTLSSKAAERLVNGLQVLTRRSTSPTANDLASALDVPGSSLSAISHSIDNDALKAQALLTRLYGLTQVLQDLAKSVAQLPNLLL
jgi:hypothetical protein